MNFSDHENGEKLAFAGNFPFYPIIDHYKIRARTNFGNTNGKSLYLHLIMSFILKNVFAELTEFTEAILKIP